MDAPFMVGSQASAMPSHDPKPGEIWLAYVEFLDHPGIGKVRPAF